jgi:hypothetical protein
LDKLTLDKLRLWPNDKQISETVRHSHRLARDLVEYAGMIQPSDISIDINASRIFVESHEIDVSSSGIDKQPHNNDDDDDDEYDLSSAVSEASLEMKRITIETDDEEQESNNDFIEGGSQLNEIAQPPDNLYILNGGDSSKLYLIIFLFIIIVIKFILFIY